MHNLVELVIGVSVELVQVCFNLLRHIRRRRRGLGPGRKRLRQSFMLTEVRDCDLLIVVKSSTFLDMLKEKSS